MIIDGKYTILKIVADRYVHIQTLVGITIVSDIYIQMHALMGASYKAFSDCTK
jgi:hypothetical protein